MKSTPINIVSKKLNSKCKVPANPLFGKQVPIKTKSIVRAILGLAPPRCRMRPVRRVSDRRIHREPPIKDLYVSCNGAIFAHCISHFRSKKAIGEKGENGNASKKRREVALSLGTKLPEVWRRRKTRTEHTRRLVKRKYMARAIFRKIRHIGEN